MLVSDTWAFDVRRMAWTAVKAAGTTPEPRECHSLTPVLTRYLLALGGLSQEGSPIANLALFAKLVKRFGKHRVIMAGGSMVAVGWALVALSASTPSGSFTFAGPGLMVMGMVLGHALPMLAPGCPLVLTFKRTIPSKAAWERAMDEALAELATVADGVGVLHLLANTSRETTVVGWRRAKGPASR